MLHGDRKDRINTAEPKPAGEIERPAWLSARARRVWDSLAPDLAAKGVLTAWDVHAFADFCAAVPINQDAMSDVAQNGASCTTVVRELPDGSLVYELRRNPAWQVARESSALITTVGGRFGLTPSDRAQLKIGEGGRGSTDDLLSG